MRLLKLVLTSFILLVISIIQMPAQLLFSDGFETYTGGGNPLDKNVAGPNSAPNGSGNPWFGPAPPNLRVVGTEGGVLPHSGNQMTRGSAPSDLDEDWVNIAYRFNGGSAYTGNITLDWWFYDPLGSGGTAYRDFGALGFYNTAPSGTDYPGSGSLNGASQIQRLSLGASSVQSAGFDSTKYQARVVGATDGYSSGWFNTSATRSVGWHEGTVLVDSLNNATFLIDGIPVLTHNAVLTYGYNVIELNADYGPTTGYFDDITLSTVPEPGMAAWLLFGGLTWLALRRRK